MLTFDGSYTIPALTFKWVSVLTNMENMNHLLVEKTETGGWVYKVGS